MKTNYSSFSHDFNIYEKYHPISDLIEEYDQGEIKYVNNNGEIITIADIELDDKIYSFLRFRSPYTTYNNIYEEINKVGIYDFFDETDLPCSNETEEQKNIDQLDVLKDILENLKDEARIPDYLSSPTFNLLILSKDKQQFTKINLDTQLVETSGSFAKITYDELSDLTKKISDENEFVIIMLKLKPLTFKLETNKLQIEKGGELTLSDNDYSSNGTVTFESDNTENGYNKKYKIVSKNFSDLKIEVEGKLFEDNEININKVGEYKVKVPNSNDITVEVIDTTPPIISVLGSKNLKLEKGSLYRDRGATSDNNEEIKVNTNLTMDKESGKYILNQVGDHTIKYTAYDEEGNIGTATRVINVEDTIGPEIVLIGNEEINHEKGLVYKDEGAYTVLGEEVEAEGEVDYNEPGNYKITYSSVDEYGNKSKSIRNINVIDTISPKISVEGEESVTLEKNSKYNDLGAYTLDKDVKNEISVENKINENKVGDYFVIYSVSDKSGNIGTTKRRVKVIDTTPPTIKLKGDPYQVIEYKKNYEDPGAYIEGEEDADNKIITYGNIDVTKIGVIQELKYVTQDKYENESSVTRQIEVKDTVPPVLKLYGEDEIDLEKDKDEYVEMNAYSDNNEKVTVSGSVDTSVVKEYTITYEAVDENDNPGTITRTVNVIDTTAPTLIVKGGDVTIEKGVEYEDQGAELESEKDKVKNFNIITSGKVLTDTPGIYYITYITTDEKLNIGTARRKVTVVDTKEPKITLKGPDYLQHERYTPYKDLGAIFKDSGIELDESLVKVESNVEIDKIGTYQVLYSATDKSGNSTQEKRTVEVIDTVPPVIIQESFDILESYETKQFNDDVIERGKNYILPKFRTDTNDSIQKEIKFTDNEGNSFDVDLIDTSKIGEYEITLTSTDEAGNIGKATKKVIIRDSTPPEIKLIGDKEITIERGTEYEDEGAEYSDNNMPLEKKYFRTETNLNINVQGDYTITYFVEDVAGNTNSVVRTVKVSDRTAPKITLKGPNPTIVAKGQNYIEKGATSDEKVEILGFINTNEIGEYKIKYKAEDEYGNESFEERIVIVKDLTPPKIKLIGEETVTIEKGSEYKDEGAVTLDNEELKKVENVNENKVGSYFVIYSAVDSYDNESKKRRIVNVIDTTPPSLELVGDREIKIEKGTNYVESGAVSDSLNQIEISGEVDINKIGSYEIKYQVFDKNGNKSEIFRSVLVVDTIKPIVTITGPEKIQLQKGQAYYDIGAKSDTGEQVLVDNKVDTSKVGSYVITYKAIDDSGNEGIATRTIEVIDTIAPVIKLKGDNPKTIIKGTVYQDDGVSIVGNEKPIITNNVNSSKIGTYFVNYKVIDESGNENSTIRVVNVIKDPNEKNIARPDYLDGILMEEEGGGVTLYIIILIVLVIAIILFFYYN